MSAVKSHRASERTRNRASFRLIYSDDGRGAASGCRHEMSGTTPHLPEMIVAHDGSESAMQAGATSRQVKKRAPRQGDSPASERPRPEAAGGRGKVGKLAK